MIRTLSHPLMSIGGAALLVTSIGWHTPAVASDPFVGQIQYFPYNFAPRGWTFCNGQLLSIASNTAVFALLGTTYGGDGRTTLGIPDMRGRAPIHPGSGPGLSTYRWGEKGGAENVTLTINEFPSHTHNLVGTNSLGDQTSPAGGALARDGRDQTYRNEVPDTDMHADSVASAGGGQAHNNMPPYLALNCNIALTGVFPSRN